MHFIVQYYFAFFPDIEYAYHVITDIWKTSSITNIDSQRKVSIKALDGNKPTTGINSGTFLSFDSFLENISPAALPTMLMGKLMNVTNVFQQQSTATTTSATEEDESLDYDQKQQQQQHTLSILSSVRIPYMNNSKRKDDNTTLTTSPNEMAPSSLASKLKRNSLFFNRSANIDDKATEESSDKSPSQSPPLSNNASQEYFRGAEKYQQQIDEVQPITINKSRPLSGSYSLSKIPRAVTDAFKSQVLRSDTTHSNVPTIEEPPIATVINEDESNLGSKSSTRSRSSSLSNFKHHISPYYLYNMINGNSSNPSASTLPAPRISNTSLTNTSADISLINDTDSSSSATAQRTEPVVKNRKQRAKSMGSNLISGTLSKLTPGSIDYYFQQQHMNENQHRHPKGPIWLNDKMIEALEKAAKTDVNVHSDSSSTSSENVNGEEETEFALDVQVRKSVADPKIRQEEQQTINEHLNANFPMLLKTEEVEAGNIPNL
jgi:hypothetical protein